MAQFFHIEYGSLYLVVFANQPKAAGGTAFVHRTLESFSFQSSKATILVDMFGYDAAPGLACLEDVLSFVIVPHVHLLQLIFLPSTSTRPN